MRTESRPAAFIDRDGVINEDLGHVGHVDEFHLLPHVLDGLSRLSGCGFALVVVTNQAGIAKGLYTEDDYWQVTNHMESLLFRQGVRLDGVYHCPHHPMGTIERYAVHCDCRKPGPGMLLQAAADLKLDLGRSVLIGDKVSDTAAGRAAGVRSNVLVRTGHNLPPDAPAHADHICDDLAAAAAWLCREQRNYQ